MKKPHHSKEDDEHRININLSDEDYRRFRILADDEARSLTNFASLIVRRFILEA